MTRIDPKFFTDDDFEEYADPRTRRRERNAAYRPPEKMPTVIAQQDDSQNRFDFTYKASRHERWWLLNSLGNFYEHQWISDVLAIVRGGKEANVYQCRGTESTGQEFIAAKVYRPRSLRSLRNDSLYREGRANLDADGREIRDERAARAMRNRTAFGQTLMHTSWLAHEFTTLQALHAAGADVPAPFATSDNAILMSYIGDEALAAPTLSSVELDPDEARPLFERVLRNVEIMLRQERIHGDLSAYNILYWEGRVTLIDFPQAISPHANQNAYRIFKRDLTRVCEYFARQGVRSNPRKLAENLWTSHGYRLMPEVHPALLDAEDERDRAYWKKAASLR